MRSSRPSAPPTSAPTQETPAFALEAEDGRYVIALRRVVYIKRFARDTRVGFGAAAPS